MRATFYKLSTLSMGEVSVIFHVPPDEAKTAVELLSVKDRMVLLRVTAAE